MDNEHPICGGFSSTSVGSFSSAKADTLLLDAAPRPLGVVRLSVSDVGQTRQWELVSGSEIIVGSGPAADLRLKEPTVSAMHAAFVHTGTAVEVRDLGARNGIHVGGARVAQASLGLGAVIELGRVFVRIEPATSVYEDSDDVLLPTLVGRSAPMRRLGGEVRRLAKLKLPVLVRGESGTGKDLVARALHDESARAPNPFIAINAATISRDLAESELFGHERGAFTGALRERRGAFREAHKGTLFLDEIASLPIDVQAKLLRVVEEGIVRPVGADVGSAVDVRLVVATCEPLEQMVVTKRFRADLYERLAVCVVRVPPLRERVEDIGLLCRHLLASSEIGSYEVAPSAITALRGHRFTGNVRELRNVVLQAAVRAKGVIRAEHIVSVLVERSGVRRDKIRPEDARKIFEETGGNVSEAARRANLPRTTMRDLIRAATG